MSCDRFVNVKALLCCYDRSGGVSAFVVAEPRECRHEEHRLADAVLPRGRFRLPVDAVDERFSSVEADAGMRSRGLDWRCRKARGFESRPASMTTRSPAGG